MKNCIKLLSVLLAVSLLLCACGGAAGERKLTIGHVTDCVYTNEYLNLRFGDSHWRVRGAEELPDTPAKILNARDGRELQDAMAGMPGVKIMESVAPNGSSVNILYMTLPPEEKKLDQDQYPDFILSNQDEIIREFERAGVSGASVTKVSVNFGGEERQAVQLQAQFPEETLCFLEIVEKPFVDYGALITVTAKDPAEAVEILEMFERPEP